MVAVLASVLALAGAPASTSVVCNPTLPVGGRTFFAAPVHIELSPTACAGLLLAATTPTERVRIHILNPGVSLDRLLGVGLLMALHEATHVALDSHDEALVECVAMKKLPGLLAQVAISPALELAMAQRFDASLPPEYHGANC